MTPDMIDGFLFGVMFSLIVIGAYSAGRSRTLDNLDKDKEKPDA